MKGSEREGRECAQEREKERERKKHTTTHTHILVCVCLHVCVCVLCSQKREVRGRERVRECAYICARKDIDALAVSVVLNVPTTANIVCLHLSFMHSRTAVIHVTFIGTHH